MIEGRGYFGEGNGTYAQEIEGSRYLDTAGHCKIGQGNLVLLSDGDSIKVTAVEKGIWFLLIPGKPIREPVPWHGPIVMNNRRVTDSF